MQLTIINRHSNVAIKYIAVNLWSMGAPFHGAFAFLSVLMIEYPLINRLNTSLTHLITRRNNMREYNQLKKAILTYLRTVETATTHDVAKALMIDIPNAGMCLLKLKRQNLVIRWPFKTGAFHKPHYQYQITDRGKERLAYYLSHTHKKGDETS